MGLCPWGTSKEGIFRSWPAPLKEVGEGVMLLLMATGSVSQCRLEASLRLSRVPSPVGHPQFQFLTCWKSKTVVSVLPEKDLVAVLGFGGGDRVP